MFSKERIRKPFRLKKPKHEGCYKILDNRTIVIASIPFEFGEAYAKAFCQVANQNADFLSHSTIPQESK